MSMRKRNRFWGAAILGVGGDEVIHVLLDVMYAEGAIYGHPARNAHSSDGRGISADHLNQTRTVYREKNMIWF